MPEKGASVRQARIAGEINRIVATSLEREHRSHLRGIVSISAVTVTRDLKTAKVFYSVFGSPSDTYYDKTYFARHAGRFRHDMAQALTIRTVPELVFEYDTTVVQAARIEELIDKINSERADESNQ